MTHIAKRPPAQLFHLSTDRWTQPFWDAAQARRLEVPRCADCATFRMPPTPFCPSCRSQNVEWVLCSGRGTVYAYTVVTRAILPGMDDCLPYVPAVVELADVGGVRLITNVVDVPVDSVVVGAPVHVVWDDVGGVTVPRFTLT